MVTNHIWRNFKKMNKLATMFLALVVLMAGFALADSPVVTTRTLTNTDSFCGSNCFEFYEDVEGTIEIKATDADNDVMTISVDSETPLPDGATFTQTSSAAGEVIYKLTWEPDSSEWDFNGFTLTFIADDGTADPTTSQDVTIRVYPDFCDRDDDDLLMTKIDIGDLDYDDDEYMIGDQVDITVENVEAMEDLENVQAKICLYNVDTEEEIDCWDSDDEYDIDDNDKEDFEVSFEIPNVEEVGKKDEYWFFAIIEAEDADEGDARCFYDYDKLDIEREKYDVLITEMVVSPSTVSCGEEFQIIVDLENVGSKDDDSVYVKFLEQSLGLDERSLTYTLENYDDRDNDATVRETFMVPMDATEKDYSIEAVVYFDDGDQTKSAFQTITVTGCTPVEPEKPVTELITLSVMDPSIIGNAFSIPVQVSNQGDNFIQYTMELTNTEAWAEPANAISVALDAGQSSTYYFYVNKKEDVTGVQGATIVLKSGTKVIKSQSLSVDTGATEGSKVTGGAVFSGLKNVDSKVFWIIGDIVLIVLALFFIKLLFTSRKK